MGTWLEDAVQALTNLGGIASLEDVYAEVRRIRPQPHIYALPASTRGAIAKHSSDSAQYAGGPDLFFSVEGLGNGVWGLRSEERETPPAIDLSALGEDSPTRLRRETYRILRDTRLARQVKLIHRSSCQLCGLSISLPNGEAYAEAHHLRPLGRPHDGPDVPGNVVVVCPNHHAMLDYGCIRLDASQLAKASGHAVDVRFIEYHNSVIVGSSG